MESPISGDLYLKVQPLPADHASQADRFYKISAHVKKGPGILGT